jgi:hypothetical protein
MRSTRSALPPTWAVRAALVTIGALLAAFPMATEARAFLAICKNCKRSYGFPGPGIGALRLDGCPLCRDPCKDDKEHAKQLRADYAALWQEYTEVRKQVTALMSAGKEVPRDLAAKEADLNYQLYLKALEWALCKERKCGAAYDGNIWDGLEGGGPPQSIYDDETVLNTDQKAALSGEKTYTKLASAEWQSVDVLDGVLAVAAEGYAPPAHDFPAARVRAARTYAQLAATYRAETARLKADPKPDPKVNFKEAAKPDLFAIKGLEGLPGEKQPAAHHAQVRVNAGEYLLASHRAMGLYRAAKGAGDKEAQARQVHAALESAWLARVHADYGREEGFKVEVAYQKALDASLEKAAKAGVKAADLLAKYQARVKESGLPEDFRKALKEGGATDAEIDAAKKRVLALKPEDVENLLAARRARFGPAAKKPPHLTIDLMAAQAQFAQVAGLHEPAPQKK